jgi:tetratricopeptide (TPR) repeat protein
MRKAVLGLLVCTAAVAVWQFMQSPGTMAAQPPQPRAVQSEHSSEQAWIVDDVVESIAAWRVGATTSGGAARVVELPGDVPSPRFEVALSGAPPITITVKHHVWAAEAYAPVVTATLGTREAATVDVSTVLAALTNPETEVLQRENLRISTILQAHPNSPDAHENAALLLATFALREAANDFSDPRRVISRMTAHLAIARHLRAEPGTTGRMASAALLTLVGRQREALDAIERLQADGTQGVAAWVRALRLRNTTDWRPTRGERGLTLLERLETLRAVQAALGSDGALDYLETFEEIPQTISWIRLVLHSGFTVEAGNRFTNIAPALELEEAQQVADAFGDVPRPSARSEAIAALNSTPAPSSIDPAAGRVRVIDWGTWAAATQRHLMMEIQRIHHHLEDHLGLSEDAKQTAGELEAYSGLTLYPLVRRYLTADASEYEQAFDAAVVLCRTRPDLVTFQAWQRLFKKPEFWNGSVARVPPLGAWFTPITPVGTAYEIALRAFDSAKEGVYPRISQPEIARLRGIAPYARMIVIANVVGTHGGYPPHTVLQQEYGDFAKYDLILARRVARFAASDPAAYVPLMRQLGALDPSELSALGVYLADRGRLAEAQQVFEEWLQGSRNQVEVSNSAYWLVRRYFDLGQVAKAEALARRVAAVHSYGGLLTLADFHEWRGELSEARRLYFTAAERYDNRIGVLAFAMRHGARSGIPTDAAHKIERELFPQGIKRVERRDVAGDPRLGISLVEVGERGRSVGLRNNDIIVAVDGIQVENDKQYRVARAAVDSPRMTLLVWRKGQYLDVETPLRLDWPLHTRREFVLGKTPVVPIGKPE